MTPFIGTVLSRTFRPGSCRVNVFDGRDRARSENQLLFDGEIFP
jgi:hypothetical protein